MTKETRTGWILLALAAVLVAGLLVTACGGAAKPGVRYHCPMHPTFVADKPGECAICGMRLVPIEEKLAPTTTPAYHCPMHPEVVSDQPGRCSKCGMKLVAAGDTAEYPRVHKTYACPVHSDFITDDPTDHCPLCGKPVVEIGTSTAQTGVGGQGSGIGFPTNLSNAGPGQQIAEGVSRGPEAGPRATGGERRILYYRNPMNPRVTSSVPTKDEMGMDYVPVYADEVTPSPGAGVPGLAAIQLTEEGIRLAGVQTAPAVEGRLARTIRTVGTVTADETRVQHFHTRVSGFVEKLYVNFTGQFVREGQPVISIYSPELLASQEEFLRARDAAGRFARSELPEVRKGGEELLAAARRRLALFDVPEQFIAELERTGEPQRAVTLLAHASGYVTSKGIFRGQQVDPGMMDLFTIADLTHVWIDAAFYEYEASLLRIGEKARLTLSYDSAVRLTGRIAYIYPTLDPETRTLKVRFDLANPDLKLKPGMFANVELDTEGATGIVIPDSAVIDTGDRQIVFVSLGGGRFEPRQVRLGVRNAGKALVLSGVAAGEEVVIRANFLLDSESQLRAAIVGTATSAPGGPGKEHP